ncbi:hypothetical protein KAM461_15540 [Aeromonas hydrophila]|nr:hypothetical protein KAM461_15540 [Aeromonas hydrophila]
MAKAFSEAKKQEPKTWATPSSPNTMAQIGKGTKTPLKGVRGEGGATVTLPQRGYNTAPSTSCGAWPPNNRSLREYPIFAHFGVVSGLER